MVTVVSGAWPSPDNVTLEQENGIIKIKNSGVTTDKLADGAISEIKLADGAVTTNKIANGSITKEKFVGYAQYDFELYESPSSDGELSPNIYNSGWWGNKVVGFTGCIYSVTFKLYKAGGAHGYVTVTIRDANTGQQYTYGEVAWSDIPDGESDVEFVMHDTVALQNKDIYIYIDGDDLPGASTLQFRSVSSSEDPNVYAVKSTDLGHTWTIVSNNEYYFKIKSRIYGLVD